MLAYSIEHGLKSEKINRVIVSTDSEKYAEIAKKYGAEVPFLRPEEYARDTSLDLEVFEHALKFLKEKEGYVPDIIVQLRPTYPIRKISDIDKMVEIMEQDETIDSVRCIAPAKEIPYKMWLKGENGEIHPLMTDIPECYNMPRQELPKAYYQNACIDVIRTRVITEGHSMLGKKIIGYEMDENFDIDTEEEFLKAAEWIREQNKKKVSVIIPCYNAENVLDNCLESLAAQRMGGREEPEISDSSMPGQIISDIWILTILQSRKCLKNYIRRQCFMIQRLLSASHADVLWKSIEMELEKQTARKKKYILSSREKTD